MTTMRAGEAGILDPAITETGKITVLDVLLILARSLRLIAVVTLIFVILGIAIAFTLSPTFIATAVILPPQQAQSTAAAFLGQLGSLGSLGGGSSLLGTKSNAELYIGILKSRTISDEIITRFKLIDVYKQKRMSDTRKILAASTEMESGKDGLVYIHFTDHDPNRASEIANGFVDALYKMNSTLAVTEAAQRRAFFDQQVAEEKTALAHAEEDLRDVQQKTGLIQPSGQTSQMIFSVAERRAEISSREVELQAMLSSDTDQNPNVVRLRTEIAALKSDLAHLEDDQSKQIEPGNITLPAGKVPEGTLEYLRRLREVKYHDALYELLAKQGEAARIDEAKSAPIVQVIDRATPPDRKSGPRRLLIMLGAAFIGVIFGCAWVLMRAALEYSRRDARRREKIHDIYRALGMRVRT